MKGKIYVLKEILYVDKSEIIYKNKKLSIEELRCNINFKKKTIIILINKNLYIKEGIIKRSKTIKDILNEEFNGNMDYLVQYSYFKKGKKGVIYACYGGDILNSLVDFIDNIEIVPIQIYISSLVKHKISNSIWNLIFSYKNTFYFIKHNENYIYFSYLSSDEETFSNKINEYGKIEYLYVLNNWGINININYQEINLGGEINE